MSDIHANRSTIRRNPATFAQEGVLLAEQAIGAPGSHNIALALRCRGTIDEQALVRAVARLSSRHQALQTSFEVADDAHRFYQTTDATTPPLELRWHSGDGLAPDEWIAASVAVPLNLQRAPLARAFYRTVDADTAILLLVIHHAIADGRSLEVLRDDIVQLYEAEIDGVEPPEPSAEPYVDFIGKTLSRDERRTAKRTERYWRSQLDSPPALTEVPGSRPTITASRKAATRRVEIPRETTTALRDIAAAEGLSYFAVVSSASVALAMRYSARSDVIFGVPFLARFSPSTEDLVGLTVNTLPLRINLDRNPEPTFLDLARNINIKSLQALMHQDVSFDELLRLADPERLPGRAPLMQLGLNHTVMNETVPVAGGVYFESIPTPNGTAALELMINCVETATDSYFYFEFDRAVYDNGAIDAFAQHLLRALKTLVGDPLTPIGSFDFLSLEETAELNRAGSLDTEPSLHSGTVYQRFEKIASASPQATAIEYDGGSWTYQALSHAATQAAHILSAAGVHLGSNVGVSLTREPRLIVHLLAILRLGATYVPLDPAYPVARLNYIRQHSLLSLIIVDSKTAEQWTDTNDVDFLNIDNEPVSSENTDQIAWQRDEIVDQTTPAYILYTSGSTGKPKGVVGLHQNILYLADWASEQFATELWRVLGATSLNFDVSVFEIFGTILNGGCLWLVTDHLSLNALGSWTAGLICIVPSVLDALLSHGTGGISSQVILTGGERLTQSLVDRVLTMMPKTKLLNGYGPTETGVYATYYECSRLAQTDPPIGKPIRNAQVAVLDRRGSQVPFGSVGQLHIGGAGLSGGYFNSAKLTQDRFRHILLNGRPRLMYETGDLVRWDTDHRLHFVGRTDDQVKVRGVRVELAEVESALTALGVVSQAAVTFSMSRQALTGYVVLKISTRTSAAELRALLSQSLPSAMVPSEIYFIPEMPLTPNGKIDRKALSNMSYESVLETPFISPREQALAAILADVLGIPSVDRHDNFFDLGGHSLLAFVFVHRVNDQFNLGLSMKQFLATPTIAAVAEVNQTSSQSSDYAVLLPLREGSGGNPLFCVHPGFGLAWSYANLLPFLSKTEPVYGVQAQGFDSQEKLPSCFQELVDHYVDVIVGLQQQGPIRLLGWSYGGLVAFAIARRLRSLERDVEELVLIDPHLPDRGATLDRFRLSAQGQAELQAVLAVAPEPKRARNIIQNLARIQSEFEELSYAGDVLLMPAADGLTPDEVQRWRTLITGQTSVAPIAADHYDMMSRSGAEQIVAAIKGYRSDRPNQ